MLGPIHNNASASPPSGTTGTGASVQSVAPDGSAAGAQAATTAPLANAEALLGTIIEALGTTVPIDRVTDLLPSVLPQTAGAVRDLAALFIERGMLSQDLAAIAVAVRDAIEAGAIARAEGEAFIDVTGRVTASADAELRYTLGELIKATTRTGEARLAAALKSGELIRSEAGERTTLLDLLAHVRGDEGLRASLRQSGHLKAFDTACDRVVARLTGVQLQNLHGLEHPYVFVELPCAPDSEIRHAQVHVFREGRRKPSQERHAERLVVLDLATTRLGDLWIALRVTSGHCDCRMNAATREAREALSEARQELVNALVQVGYTAPRVHIGEWDGDRLREVALLMQRRARVDFTV